VVGSPDPAGGMSLTIREQLLPWAHGTQRACVKKSRYAGWGLAERVREKRDLTGPDRLYTYHCQHCDGWHITKLKPPGA
jgi:hypothetical protein